MYFYNFTINLYVLTTYKTHFHLCVILQNKDETHDHNFERRRMQAEIKTFLKYIVRS